MGKAEVGTPKYIANQMKARGLQRLKWYCQVCEKQCRDDNGFKCHTQSESHVRKMLVMGDKAKESIEEYSQQFLKDFVFLLRTGHGEKGVNANRFYQEYIGNRDHIHMNATKWTSLSDFIRYLGTQGICRVQEDASAGAESAGTSSALTISWIDNSPETMKRQEALKKKERVGKDEESMKRHMMDLQIRKAQAAFEEKQHEESNHRVEHELNEPQTTNAPVKISIASKSSEPAAAKPTASNTKPNPFKAKPGNVFKVSKSTNSTSGISSTTAKKPSALERIMLKDQARKKTYT